ncbi:MAG: hypothetical protein WC091_20370 [Sulfuricellaceae bacterium]
MMTDRKKPRRWRLSANSPGYQTRLPRCGITRIMRLVGGGVNA